MSRFYSYVYADPRDEMPFYVGKGCARRAYSKKNRSVAVLRRIDEIAAAGLKHSVTIYEEKDEKGAFSAEKRLILSLGRVIDGSGPLLNHTMGGNGCFGRQSDEGRKAIGAAMAGNARRKGKFFSNEELARISAGVKRTMTPERLEKLRMAGLKGSMRSAEIALNRRSIMETATTAHEERRVI